MRYLCAFQTRKRNFFYLTNKNYFLIEEELIEYQSIRQILITSNLKNQNTKDLCTMYFHIRVIIIFVMHSLKNFFFTMDKDIQI